MKVCITCLRPFNWRKKWEKCWEEVTTCSSSCNRQRRLLHKSEKWEDSVLKGLSAAGKESREDQYNVDSLQIDALNDRSTDEAALSYAQSEKETSGTTASGEADHEQGSEVVPVTNILTTWTLREKKGALDANCSESGKSKSMKCSKKRGSKDGSKPCDICGTEVDILIRCRTDSSRIWRMVCTDSCWKQVSGGVTDGDDAHPYYQYGGLWKNRRKV